MLQGPLLLAVFIGTLAFLLITVIRFKVHPFLALLFSCFLAGILTGMPLDRTAGAMVEGFGKTLQSVGLVIGLGIIFGALLSDSGATRKIAEFLAARIGARNAPLAINLTGFLVSIPVFMDAAFVILVSLAKDLARIAKHTNVALVVPLAVGLIVSHNLIAPTPGPVAVANQLDVSVGSFALWALVVGLPAVLVGGWLYGRLLGRLKIAEDSAGETASTEAAPDLDAQARPGASASFFLLLLPILLIFAGSALSFLVPQDSSIGSLLKFLGDKNVAMISGVLASMLFLRRCFSQPTAEIIGSAAEKSGGVLLITGAGGALGATLSACGVGAYIADSLAGLSIPLTVAGFLLAAVLRAALGSSTVALITSASLLAEQIANSGASALLVGLAICAGGNCLSLPNDSGFWVVNRFGKLSVRQTLAGWTLGGTIAGTVAFLGILCLQVAGIGSTAEGSTLSRSENKDKIVEMMVEGRKAQEQVPLPSEVFGPFSLEEAYRIEGSLAARLEKLYGPVAGYKVAFATEDALKKYDLEAPVTGSLYKSFEVPNGGSVSADAFFLFHIEAEIVFILAKDILEPLDSVEALAPYVASVHAGLDIADERFDIKEGQARTISDFVANGSGARYFMIGEGHDPRSVNLDDLTLSLYKDGEKVYEGHSTNIMGSPWNVLLAIANAHVARGNPFRAGQAIVSGKVYSPFKASGADAVGEYIGDCGALGKVSLTVR